jgi:Flp pilus assembly pilin Flp
MLEFYIRLQALAMVHVVPALQVVARRVRRRDEGQTTAEYALVILAAAAVAIVLIAWARSSGKLPAFFNRIIDEVTNGVP